MLVDATVGGWPSYSSGLPGGSIGIQIRDVFIDGQFSPAAVDGIASFGSVAAVRFSDIGMNDITGHGIIGYPYFNTTTFAYQQPDEWHGERVIGQNVTGDTFGQFIFNDCTFIDFHAQGGGPGGEANVGFNINQSSVRLIACRSEFRQTSFLIKFNNGGSSGNYAPIDPDRLYE